VLGRVPLARPFPDVTALMPPADSLPPSAPAPVPLAVAARAADACAVPLGPTTRVPADGSGVGDGSPARRLTGMRRGAARASPGTGPSSACGLWAHPPPATPPASPNPASQGMVVAFREYRTLGIREAEVSGPQSPGPHVRLPPHRRTCFQDRRQACSRLGRAPPWPDGMCTQWTLCAVSWWHRRLPFPSAHRAWSHWISYPLREGLSRVESAQADVTYTPLASVSAVSLRRHALPGLPAHVQGVVVKGADFLRRSQAKSDTKVALWTKK
jgi:hypothetical protein